MSQILNNIHALITRPQKNSEQLAYCIEQQGACALIIPMIVIKPLAISNIKVDYLFHLDQYDKVIVTSQHAARISIQLIKRYWSDSLNKLHWFVFGEATYLILHKQGIKAIYSKQDNTSESLLKLPELQKIKGEKILLIKGKGGREYLYNTLLFKEAIVDKLTVYQRYAPNYRIDEVRQEIKSHSINVIVALSGETINNLYAYLSKSMLALCAIIVPSDRVAQIGKKLGFKRIFVANSASSNDIIAVMQSLNDKLII